MTEPAIGIRRCPSKEIQAETHRQQLATLPSGVRVIYTDGSKQGANLGWALVERHPRALIPATTKSGHLKEAEVFDAEVKAIHAAVKKAIRGSPVPTRVYSDSQAAVDACTRQATTSSQKEALEVQRILRAKRDITLDWCPGHQGIRGNEEADLLAKEATTMQSTQEHWTPTVARVKALAREKRRQLTQQWWDEYGPDSYKWLELGPYPDTKGLTRPQMATLVAHRTRHGHFASYYRRFGIQREDPRCRCGTVLEPRHLTLCGLTWGITRRFKDKHKIATEEDLFRLIIGRKAREFFLNMKTQTRIGT